MDYLYLDEPLYLADNLFLDATEPLDFDFHKGSITGSISSKIDGNEFTPRFSGTVQSKITIERMPRNA